jgi:glutamate-ammonia-ligase adenylyltransferase
VDARVKLKPPDDLPAPLAERFLQVGARLADIDGGLPPEYADSAGRVLTVSQFVQDTLVSQPEALIARLGDSSPVSRQSISDRLKFADASERDAQAKLRRFRDVELAAIAWRDIAGIADLDRTLADLSELADSMIALALEKSAQLLEPRFGRPAPLLVLAMGKLGGHELNFSSDIDLILVYPDPDEGDGDEFETYFLKLSQRLIKLLDERTADGMVYRVDTRLRPFGNSGPLALSIGALESYLVRHGRDWERYAYVKARLVTGESYADEVFDQVLTPFVYRRYLDFGVFDAIRHMKRLISQDVVRHDKHDNIKLGRGGIREVEFIAQLFQLLRGGQEPELRSRNLLTVLSRLSGSGIIDLDLATGLAESYRFLRTAENRLQALDDRQTHEIPADPLLRARWAWAAGFPSWSGFASELERHRDRVQLAFDEFHWQTDHEAGEGDDAIRVAWDARQLAATRLNPALEPLDQLRDSGLYRRMDEISRQRLGAFVSSLVPALESIDASGEVLTRVMPVIRSICRRSAYLALLLENPSTLSRLLELAGQSAMLARLLAEHPVLLDELLDARLFERAPTRADIEAGLDRQIAAISQDDTEGQLNAMRDFQRATLFRIAIADRFGDLPLMQVSDRLTDIAEIVIGLALGLAGRELEQKHGVPMHGEGDDLAESGMIVVAYGKLGGLELGYGSDLDLVFLHDSEGGVQESTGPAVIDNQRYFVRLVRRLIHFLSVQTSSGRLYEIDTRLRPDGASGMLVASLGSFARYQRDEAWAWEHQALLRSRSVAGPCHLQEAFERVRLATLTSAVKRDSLKDEVARMRRRMRTELATGTALEFDIKQDTGGLADIEFLIDYWVLVNADRYPSLVEYPDNVRQLEALAATGLVPAPTCLALKDDYLYLRAQTHELALSDRGRLVPAKPFAGLRSRVRSLWEQTFGEAPV